MRGRRCFFLFFFLIYILAPQTVSKRVDGMREANEKMESERDAATAEATAGRTQIQALQAQVPPPIPPYTADACHDWGYSIIWYLVQQ